MRILSGLDRVLVYSVESGLWVGQLEVAEGTAVRLRPGARRIWHWSGAATRSEVADLGADGKMPAPCQGPVVVMGVCEILQVSDAAWKRLYAVPVWSAVNGNT